MTGRNAYPNRPKTQCDLGSIKHSESLFGIVTLYEEHGLHSEQRMFIEKPT